MNTNILITSAGKRVSLVRIFKSTLLELNINGKVFTSDMNPSMAPACYVSDGYFKVLRVTNDNYIDELIDICVNNNISIIIPTIDTELLILALNKDKLSAHGITPIISEYEFIKICRDKRKTNDLFKSFGIKTPQIIDIKNPTFPIFAKPYDGSLSQNIHILLNDKDLTDDIINDPKLMFMELIDDKRYSEYTVDIYFGKDSNVKSIVPRKRIEIRAGEINKGITAKNNIVNYLYKHLKKLSGIRGCLCMQLFFNEDLNDIIGIEINPRFGGGYPLSFHAGANYAKYIIKEYILNREIEYSDDWENNTLMLRYDEDIIIHNYK